MKFLRANILPLALVMTAAILLGGVTLGIILIGTLRRSAETDDSMVAYYAADAGIERQLYEVRKKNTLIGDLASLNGSFSNGSTWESASSSRFAVSDEKLFPEILEGDFQFVDLFDPDNAGAAAGIGKVEWSWTDPGTPGCEVELGIAEWDVTSPSIIPGVFQLIFRTGGGPESYNLDINKAYRLRFRPRKCDITNLNVQVFSSPSDISADPFPGDITIASDGMYERSTQSIAVTMPRLDVLSGIFSYVIFTECTLFKDPESGIPPC